MTTDLAFRLLLEQRCAETGRAIARGFRNAHVFLAMFTLGDGGSLAWFSTADMPATRTGVARWVESGAIDAVRVSSAEEVARWAETMRGLADRLKQACLPGTGFTLILFVPTLTLAYASTGHRDDVRTALREWLGKDGGGQEVPEA